MVTRGYLKGNVALVTMVTRSYLKGDVELVHQRWWWLAGGPEFRLPTPTATLHMYWQMFFCENSHRGRDISDVNKLSLVRCDTDSIWHIYYWGLAGGSPALIPLTRPSFIMFMPLPSSGQSGPIDADLMRFLQYKIWMYHERRPARNEIINVFYPRPLWMLISVHKVENR